MDVFVYLLFGEENYVRQRLRNRRIFKELRIYRRHLRDVSDPFSYPDHYFSKFYRMPPYVALRLIDLLNDSIARQDNTKLPVHLQVLTALRFFAEGSLQKGVGQDFSHPMSQASVSRCLKNVFNSLCEVSNELIQFPQTREKREEISNRFQLHNRIPGILGLMDCVVVKMIRPKENEEAFFNHKHGHSMNVQVISDSDYIIQSVRICPGSNNDRFIWKHSDIRRVVMNLRENEYVTQSEGNYYLLGDSGYTPSPILLTPVRNVPEDTAAGRYTRDHVTCRCRVEQLFGLLSNIWWVFSRRRPLQYKPRKVAKIILACCVLHNFREKHGIIYQLQELEEQDDDYEEPEGEEYRQGLAERQRLIDLYY